MLRPEDKISPDRNRNADVETLPDLVCVFV